MRVTKLNQIFGMLAVTATLYGVETALAQNAAPSSMKTIGTPSSAKPQIVPSLFALNSRGATLQGDRHMEATGDHGGELAFTVAAVAGGDDGGRSLCPMRPEYRRHQVDAGRLRNAR